MSDEVNRLKSLIKLMNDNDLLELEIAEEGRKVRLKKKYEGVRKEILAMPSAVPGQGFAEGAPAAGKGVEGAEAEGTITVRSPMVGTFYRAPSPEADMYTDVGQEVREGSVLCLIEAMKVFNEIKSPGDGEVAEILVRDSEPVEYNQPLFLIKPAGTPE